MDDAFYMLVICAGVSCTPIGRDGYYLMQEESFSKRRPCYAGARTRWSNASPTVVKKLRLGRQWYAKPEGGPHDTIHMAGRSSPNGGCDPGSPLPFRRFRRI